MNLNPVSAIRICLSPGYQFKSVDAMMNVYQHAVDQAYRFFSYVDVMFLNR